MSTADKQEKRRANQLEGETSTYLLQHAYNPVNWYPWGQEALQKALAESKPILLSIGYSACHWCHVMEHESFEDEATAKIMNEFFINIKVDREERPDIDEIYMKSVQMLTGHGGWPMTVFLTPNLKPFFAGTYFPPQDRHGIPGFQKVLAGVHKAWTTQRNDVEESSEDITKHLALLDKIKEHDTTLDARLIDDAIDRLLASFDRGWGGFGGAPKFPHTASLSLGMRRIKPGCLNKTGRELECSEMVNITLDRMAQGGIHDQVGGGFARYSVDRQWLVPHFEKMLYDNALLVRTYLDGYLITGKRYWLRVAKDCLEFVLRELSMPEGGFYCSLDADSEGEEGKFYVWRPEETRKILGEENGNWLNEVFGITDFGNFEHGTSVAHLTSPPEDLASRFQLSEDDFWKRLDPLRVELLQEREKRVRPGRDDKMLTSWSSLMISALVDGYKVIGDKRYLDAAQKAARFIREKLYVNGRLLHTFGRGQAKLNGYLEDYAYYIQALLDLAAVDANSLWYETALELNRVVLDQFWDADESGFFFTGSDHEELIVRTKHFYDGSTPSATSVSTFNLLRIAKLTGNNELAERAYAVIKLYSLYFSKAPDQFANLICALDFYLAEGSEIAVVFDSNKEDAQEIIHAVHQHYLPNSVVLIADTASKEKKGGKSPLLEQKQAIDGKPTVYICRHFSCQKPITDREILQSALSELGKV